MRLPSSFRAGVNLCGVAVDVSPEVLLHDEQRHTADGRTTLTGELLPFIFSSSDNDVKTSNQ